VSDYVWTPTQEYVEKANVTRFGRRHGIDSIDGLRARSVTDISWYWDAAVADLGLVFDKPYSAVVDLSAGIAHPEWFIGGTLNIVDSCITRWINDPEVAGRDAIVHENEAGAIRRLTYRELNSEVERASAGLRDIGIGIGDAVGLFLPLIPEAAIAYYALARIGAVIVPLFSGFAPYAIASRIQDSGAKAVICADGTLRRGKKVEMRAHLHEALATCPSVENVIIVENLSPATDLRDDELTWADLLASESDPGPIVHLDPSATLLLAYTSGTTGRPKGAVHTHAGFLTKTASEVAYSFDVSVGGVFCWVTDMGWIMGPLSITGSHSNGATLMLYEGALDVPDTTRLWQLVQRHGVTMLGVSPTLIRVIRASGSAVPDANDLSSVRVIGSTGEPWDPDSYEWLASTVFRALVPMINFSGGTEVGGSFLAPYPVEPIPSCSVGGPSLGMDVDIVDDKAQPVSGSTVGELVCRQPWPAMTRSVWQDDQRYMESYWSTFPGLWRHGDFAHRDPQGHWYISGRSDDVMNVAGKRLASAEVEEVLTSHADVAEAAAIGVPDAKKGEAVWVFWVARPGVTADASEELRAMVSDALGKSFAPSRVIRVPQLPKTMSGKIARRVVRAASLGTDPGDLSGIDNPESIPEIRRIVDTRG